jgi:hypothetical protein
MADMMFRCCYDVMSMDGAEKRYFLQGMIILRCDMRRMQAAHNSRTGICFDSFRAPHNISSFADV